jgi:nucleotidyltransferase/DNA polymerase involved in DNA repair
MTALPRLLLVECPALTVPALEPAATGATGDAATGDGATGRRMRLFARVVDVLTEVCPWIDPVRPGVCTLPIKGPTRYFGSEQAVLVQVAEAVRAVIAAEPAAPASAGTEAGVPADAPPASAVPPVRLGVADGLFAASLAARVEAVVATGETVEFLASWPVDVLGDPDLADVLVRLGLSTLGRFAAVPASDVAARFGAAGAHCHRVARGLDGELPGWRVPGTGRRLVAALGRDLALIEHQPGFWGGTSAVDERAAGVLTDLQRRLGPEAVAVAVLVGGRGPADRSRLVPWRPAGASTGQDRAQVARAGRAAEPPWPGHLPPPAPARVPAGCGDRGMVADVVDGAGAPIAVTGRGLLTGRPVRLSIGGGPFMPVAGWSAPWPVEERWWSRGRRRAARLQVLAGSGEGDGEEGGPAYLLVVERGRWWVEAAYE